MGAKQKEHFWCPAENKTDSMYLEGSGGIEQWLPELCTKIGSLAQSLEVDALEVELLGSCMNSAPGSANGPMSDEEFG